MVDTPIDVLTRVFGYSSFRGLQAQVIERVLAGGDSLVLMPTGGGKSICYQVPALCRPGVGVVISPLIALMQDQVTALRQAGVDAAALNSSLDPYEARDIEDRLRAGALDLIYVAPERLLTAHFLEMLDHIEIALFAIDEAHCVSQWGHDFRPEYMELNILAERFPGVPRIALTATADGPTRGDILDRLRLPADGLFIAGFDRPNIRYRIQPKAANVRQQLKGFLKDHQGAAGIVYCLSRAKVEETAAWLSNEGYPSLPYHAGLEKGVRAHHQNRFLIEDGLIIVATIAFGMGIDKPDVRFVAHLDLPKSIEAYYQETGRAGRDGLPAEAWMAYGLQDVVKLSQFIENSEAPDAQKRVERQKLDALLGLAETSRCRRQVLLEYFGEELPEPCGNCDTCLEPIETFDGTEAARKALSCVYRTGEIFGAAYIIDVLLGGDTERIRKFGHDQLSTYGIGDEFSRNEWRSVFRQLVTQGLLTVDIAGHGGLKLGPDCRPVLRGEQSVDLRREAVREPVRRAAKSAATRPELEAPADRELFEALRQRRAELAREQGVPPYVVFHDRTLAEMATVRPRDMDQMASINGVGASKLERYGDEFLAIVSSHPGA